MKKKILSILIIFNFYCVNAQYTAIPDPYFEQELINQDIDSDGIINGQVLTSDINLITSLELNSALSGQITSIEGIENFSSLESLNLNTQNLENCNLTNPLLQTLYVFFLNSIITFDISSLSQLKFLYINNCILPDGLNLTNNVSLETLGVLETPLFNIDLSNNINLKTLALNSNFIGNLDISNNINLTYLGCSFNNITSINVSNNILLETLGISYNAINSIDLSNNLLLKSFGCTNNSFSSLDVSSNILLETLAIKNNTINTLVLNSNPLINNLDCSNNNMSSLYIQNNNNSLLNGTYTTSIYTYNRFDATNNPNLHCIFVDDVANCNTNWAGIDLTSHFVTNQTACDAILSNPVFKNNNILNLYPNPTKDILNINNNQNININQITIYDFLGKIFLTENNNFNQINTSNLQNGLYFVKINTEKGSFIEKIIKN